jgi:tRNA(Ile2) C34 agmatinyltransferase TiaS
MEMNDARSDQVEQPKERQLVRCNSCRATMQDGLFRCPHCGQITSGNEKPVTEFALTQQMKARAAGRKDRICNICGKRISKGTLCENCDTKNSKKKLLFIVLGVVLLLTIMFYLMS